MKKAFMRQNGKAGFELIEEAFVLLRSSPPSVLAAYYLGSVPFVAGFLIFCSDLAGSPSAPGRLGGATLAMAALFFWMKFFQARFARLLLDRLSGREPQALLSGEAVRLASNQAILHASGLFILPLAVIAMVPLCWVYAFYQNVTAMDDGRMRARDLARMAWQQSTLWWIQNYLIFGVLSVFGLYVFINWISIGFLSPQLLKMFFGVESVFTLNPQGMLNTTFFAAMAALTYLSVDPLFKACYVLRCFYGRSVRSGDDLRTEIRSVSSRLPAVLACLFLFVATTPLSAQTPTPAPVVHDTELDQAITTVLRQDKYIWRTPPEKAAEKKDGLLAGFLKIIGDFFKKFGDWIQEAVRKFVDWLFPRDRQTETKADGSWMTLNHGLLFAILVLAICALGFGAVRIIRTRRKSVTVQSTNSTAMPDIADENTRADELPEDDWTRMGRSLLEQGDLRLALRAFYLASLSHLASRGLITITRSKSNRDYERELLRRGHAIPDLPALFGENVGIFDRIWYGLHDVNAELVGHFVRNLERMKIAT
jgi:hypothetical protein